MALPQSFLDELRARTALSALIGASVKLVKAGREHKGCCPFHAEKTASFTVNDEKGFAHCFGCQWHGDAIRWLMEARGLGFIDAVKELAEAAGMAVPAPTPEARAREEKRAGAAEVLARAAEWYSERLSTASAGSGQASLEMSGEERKALEWLEARGIGREAIERFGIGFAPAKASVAACGVAPELLAGVDLLVEDGRSGLWRDRFVRRIMIPIHDARGRVCGFAGRFLSEGDEAADQPSQPTAASSRGSPPKYVNSPESGHFRKGELLFNLHRAAQVVRGGGRPANPAAGAAGGGLAVGPAHRHRLLIVEGQLDAVALDQAGIGEVVAPMGTAVTAAQLERAWRVAQAPVLLFDGDAAGRGAALKAAERALAAVGPGRTLRVAALPQGEDPDSLVRTQGPEAIEALVAEALPLDEFLWRAALAAAA